MRKLILGILSLAVIFLLAFEQVENDFETIESYDNSEVVVVDFDMSDNFSYVTSEVSVFSNEANAPPQKTEANFEQFLIDRVDKHRSSLENAQILYSYNVLNFPAPVIVNQHSYPMLC